MSASEKASASSAANCVVNHQEYHRSANRDPDAVKIQACYPCRAEHLKKPTADNRADYTKQNIEHDALAVVIDQVAGNESGQQPKDYPSEERHNTSRRVFA
jgi:hypothetical protein